MRRTTLSASVLALIIAVPTAWGTAWSAEPMAQSTTKWEYRVLSERELEIIGQKDLTTGLNKLGEEGWELVAVGGAYIFKRPKLSKDLLEDIKGQVALAEAELAMQKERVAWAERMAAKGFLSQAQFEADQQRLRVAESTLEKAKKQLEALPTEARK